ncbi:hypothetical protein GLW03_03650 [Halobacillus halophilus]|nr:hypothetical protein [Halobacillus halophilus]MYL28909.1 hypothetical protein [Halobacillus halophilus]
MVRHLKRFFISLTTNNGGMVFPWVLMVTLVFILLISRGAASYENQQRLTQSHHFGIMKKHLLERARQHIDSELAEVPQSEAGFSYTYHTANGTAEADCMKESDLLWKCSWILTVHDSGDKYVVTYQYPDK